MKSGDLRRYRKDYGYNANLLFILIPEKVEGHFSLMFSNGHMSRMWPLQSIEEQTEVISEDK